MKGIPIYLLHSIIVSSNKDKKERATFSPLSLVFSCRIWYNICTCIKDFVSLEEASELSLHRSFFLAKKKTVISRLFLWIGAYEYNLGVRIRQR